MITRQIQGDGIDQHLAFVQSSNAYWYLTDHLGSTRATINNSGTVQDSLTYDAYGNMSQSAPTAQPLYTYSGREVDVETGLQYNRARWYDPSTGRWITQDPLGFDAGDSNLYRYVNNGPDTYTDSSGESVDPLRIIGTAKAITIAGTGQLALTPLALALSIPIKKAREIAVGAIEKALAQKMSKALPSLPASYAKLISAQGVGFAAADLTRAALMVNVVRTWAGGVLAQDNANNAFVFTMDEGWIDLGHFWLSSLAGYLVGQKAAYGMGLAVEFIQALSPRPSPLLPMGINKGLQTWRESAFTVEDLRSDWLGSQFGAELKQNKAKFNRIQAQFSQLLKSWGPVDFDNAGKQVKDILFDEAAHLQAETVTVPMSKWLKIPPPPFFGFASIALRFLEPGSLDLPPVARNVG